MPAISEVLAVLYPQSSPGIDWVVVQDSDGTRISHWNTELGTKPSQAELDAVTQSQVDAARIVKTRTQAKAYLGLQRHESAVLRALMLTLLDEMNLHAARVNSLLTAIDNASTLATLKTAVAGINDIPIRTGQQLRNTIVNKLDAGDGDT